MSSLRTVILAAGKGTRMKSALPKVLHPVCGKPILAYVVDVAKALRSLKTYIVIGHGAQAVRSAMGEDLSYVLQPQLLGTGDALKRVKPMLAGYRGTVLVMCGDTPLLSKDIVAALVKKHRQQKASATVLTAVLRDAAQYGRIVRNDNNDFIAIREFKDATAHEVTIKEINVGVYCFEAPLVLKMLDKIKINPNKKEFYLTDIIELFLAQGERVATLTTHDENVAFGVNNRIDLAVAQQVIRARILTEHMLNGVTVVDPATTYIEAGVQIGEDTVINPMTFIHSGVRLGSNCSVGPFARIRPGTVLADKVEIGNFAEVSRTRIGRGTMMKHFSFLGDARLGSNVNVGAGVVTANYDGKDKNQTRVDDNAFIGSDSILVAPVSVGKKAVVGAGSVVTRNTKVPPGAVARGVPAKIFKK